MSILVDWSAERRLQRKQHILKAPQERGFRDEEIEDVSKEECTLFFSFGKRPPKRDFESTEALSGTEINGVMTFSVATFL